MILKNEIGVQPDCFLNLGGAPQAMLVLDLFRRPENDMGEHTVCTDGTHSALVPDVKK